MRLTTLGKFSIFLLCLTLWNAANGGLNLLYLIYSGMAGAFIVAAILTRIAARRIDVEITRPEQIFADETVPLTIRFTNRSIFPVFGVSVVTRYGRVSVGDIGGRRTETLTCPYRFPRRGLSDITDLVLEVRFPFGLFARRRRIAGKGIVVFPELLRDFEARRSRDLAEEEVARPMRGVGDEFWGVREYNPGDDMRLISWKLSAKLGRPLIKEYAQMVGDRVVVRVSGSPPGEETERRISEAASVARFYIDEGAEVRLVTDEGDSGYGRGLLHLGAMLGHLATLGEGKEARPTGEPVLRKDALPAIGTRGTLHALTYVMAAVVAASLLLVEGLDPVTKIGIWVAIAAGLAFDRLGKYPIPAWFLNVLSVVVLLFVFAVDIPSGGLLPGLTHLLVYVIANRLMSPKKERDTGVIALVCFLMFLLIAWQTVKPAFLIAYAAFFTAAAFWATSVSNDRARVGARRIAAVLVSVVLMLTLAGAAFALTPRFSNPRFAKMMRRLGLADVVLSEMSIVKLADSVRLGAFNDVRSNSRRIMQVKIDGLSDGEDKSLLIRGGALDRFEGEGWDRTEMQFRYRLYGQTIESVDGKALYGQEADGYNFTTDGFIKGKGGVVQEFYIYPMESSLIFSVGDPTAISGRVVLPTLDLSGTAYSSTDHESGGRYVVISQSIPVRLYEGVENYDDYMGALFLQLPRDVERVADLAEEVTRGAASDMERAFAIEEYFHENYVYSYLGAHGRQSLDEFLFETKGANCEYFATGMAVMLRTLGIPSRLIVGYLTNDWQKVGGYFDVRNSDGHSWVEAFMPGQGWVAFDPTPEITGLPSFAFPLGRTLGTYLLQMQMSWYRYVVGYDFYIQQDMLSALIAKWRRILIAIVSVLIGSLLVAGIFMAVRARLRISRIEGAVRSSSAAYERAERWLARRGHRRGMGETPGEFALSVVRANPHLDVLEKFTRAYYEWRYGDADGREAMGLMQRLRGAIRRHTESAISLK